MLESSSSSSSSEEELAIRKRKATVPVVENPSSRLQEQAEEACSRVLSQGKEEDFHGGHRIKNLGIST